MSDSSTRDDMLTAAALEIIEHGYAASSGLLHERVTVVSHAA